MCMYLYCFSQIGQSPKAINDHTQYDLYVDAHQIDLIQLNSLLLGFIY